MQSSISWQRLSTYTCSYQLVFAITTVNFVIRCYFLKIADQVDCQLYLHSYLIFFAILQTVRISIFQRRQNVAKSRRETEVAKYVFVKLVFVLFNSEANLFST